MKRRLFNWLAGLSLLLFVVTTGLWVRSFHTVDRFIHIVGDDRTADLRQTTVYLERGRFKLEFSDDGYRDIELYQFSKKPLIRWNGFDEFAFYRESYERLTDSRFYDLIRMPPPLRLDWNCWRNKGNQYEYFEEGVWLYIPLPPVVIVELCAPMLFAIRLIKQRKSIGGCKHCGYDLRATPDRCPECGAMSRPL